MKITFLRPFYFIVVLNLGELNLAKDFDVNYVYYSVNFGCVAELIHFYV